MKLYFYPLSSYSQKVLTALYEKNVEFTPEMIRLDDAEERAKYRELYPLGKVPLLVLDDGYMIPESSIIIEYVDTHHEGARLIPSDPDSSRRTRFYDRMYDLYLNDSVTSLVFEGFKPEDERDQKTLEKANFRIDVMYGYMDDHFAESTWTMGDDFTMADCAAAPALFYAQQYAPFTGRTNIESYYARLAERASFARVIEQTRPYLEELTATA